MTPRKPAKGTVSLYLRISPALKAWLQDYADSQDTPLNTVATKALEFYLEHQAEESEPDHKNEEVMK